MNSENANCSIHNECERIVPSWLVLLDNIPTAILFVLGVILVDLVWWPLAILMMIYNLASIVLFWALICRYCHHFNTRACPCGYGVIAPKWFRRIEGGNFRKIFRRNIAIMYPCWLFPLVAGLYLLYARYPRSILIVFSAFVIVGFILIPAISKLVGCKGCDLKDQCPWMTSESKEDSAHH